MKIPAAFAILIFCNVLSLHGESAPIEENQTVSVTTAQSGNNVANKTVPLGTLPQNTSGDVGPAGPTPSNVAPKDNSSITANVSKDNSSYSVGNSTTTGNETTAITPHGADNTTVVPIPTPTDNTTVAPITTTPIPPPKTTTPTPKTTTPTPKTTTPITPSTTVSPGPFPNTTTETPKPEPTTQIPVVTTTPAPVVPTTPAPHRNRFDGPSFIGGIVLSLGLVAIGFIGWKYYKARTERNYRTL